MGICYRKLRDILVERNVTSYTLTKKCKLISHSAWVRIMSDGHLDTVTICKLCEFLGIQPGDMMEYIPEGERREE